MGDGKNIVWRVWCEHLPLAELRSPAVLALLARHRMSPVVAVRPKTHRAELLEALECVRDAGLETAVWPLMSLEDGYWPSERNAAAWFAQTYDLLAELERAGATPDWVAVDIEPPYGQASRLLRETLQVPVAALELAAENMDLERFFSSRGVFHDGVAAIRGRGIRTLGVTSALAAHDLRDDIPLWQDMLETPWTRIPWDAAGIMAYGSIVAGASRGVLSIEDARAIHQPLLGHLGRRFGARAHASLGVTGAGIFGDEPAYSDPEDLSRDVAAALSAGIRDIAIFCLEGILAQGRPEHWLHAVCSAEAREPPPTWKATVARRAGAAARLGCRAIFGR